MIAQTTTYATRSFSIHLSAWECVAVGVAIALLTILWIWLRKPRWRDRNQ